jgi:beta-glucosidase
VSDIAYHHKLVADRKEAAALALSNGCDLNCGKAYRHLMDAYEEDLITEEQITEAAIRLYTIRVMLGEFEDPRPYTEVTYKYLDAPEHRQLNLEAAQQTLVLLKNENNFLPLNPADSMKIAVVGPNAMSHTALEGNYHGHASEYITPVDGIRQVFTNAHVTVATGSDLCIEERSSWAGFRYLHTEGAAAASEADVTVLCLGLDRTIEGEETGLSDDFTEGGDKKSLGLPAPQLKLAKAVCDVCDNVIIVLMSGSSMDVGPEVSAKAKAIIQAWYPGALGGLAIARLLGGHCNPSGKLPMTFCKVDQNLPPLTDYSMDGRTYRFMKEEPLYPFGYGLSYTRFNYENAVCSEMSDSYMVSAEVSNTGVWPGWAKVQVYASYTDSRTRTPNFQLCALRPIYLLPGEKKTVTVFADKYWMQAVLPDGARVTPDGTLSLFIGDHQPDELSTALSGNACLEMKIK